MLKNVWMMSYDNLILTANLSDIVLIESSSSNLAVFSSIFTEMSKILENVYNYDQGSGPDLIQRNKRNHLIKVFIFYPR